MEKPSGIDPDENVIVFPNFPDFKRQKITNRYYYGLRRKLGQIIRITREMQNFRLNSNREKVATLRRTLIPYLLEAGQLCEGAVAVAKTRRQNSSHPARYDKILQWIKLTWDVVDECLIRHKELEQVELKRYIEEMNTALQRGPNRGGLSLSSEYFDESKTEESTAAENTEESVVDASTGSNVQKRKSWWNPFGRGKEGVKTKKGMSTRSDGRVLCDSGESTI
jgi:hypothetical protein